MVSFIFKLIAGKLFKALAGLWGWVRDNPGWSCAALFAVALWFSQNALRDARSHLGRETRARKALALALADTIKGYTLAAKTAREAALAARDKVVNTQNQNAKEIQHALTSDNNALRARIERLRRDDATETRNHSRGGGVSAFSPPSGGPAPAYPRPGEALGGGMVAVRIDTAEEVIREAQRGRAIQSLWKLNEATETPTPEE